jgi:hypothetical protein
MSDICLASMTSSMAKADQQQRRDQKSVAEPLGAG